jgi:hypothetical protein
MDLEGIVAKHKSGPYVADRESSTWVKILNRNYSQKRGREELFERDRHREPVAGWHSCAFWTLHCMMCWQKLSFHKKQTNWYAAPQAALEQGYAREGEWKTIGSTAYRTEQAVDEATEAFVKERLKERARRK